MTVNIYPFFGPLISSELCIIDKQVSQEEDQGRVARGTAPAYHDADEESASLLDTSLPTRRPTRSKRKDCCMCCGMKYVS